MAIDNFTTVVQKERSLKKITQPVIIHLKTFWFTSKCSVSSILSSYFFSVKIYRTSYYKKQDIFFISCNMVYNCQNIAAVLLKPHIYKKILVLVTLYVCHWLVQYLTNKKYWKVLVNFKGIISFKKLSVFSIFWKIANLGIWGDVMKYPKNNFLPHFHTTRHPWEHIFVNHLKWMMSCGNDCVSSLRINIYYSIFSSVISSTNNTRKQCTLMITLFQWHVNRDRPDTDIIV